MTEYMGKHGNVKNIFRTERKIMKKRIFSIFIIAALAAAMAGCGGSKKEAETEAAAETAAETEAAETEASGASEDAGSVGGLVTEDGEYIEEQFVEGKVSYIDGDTIGVEDAEGSVLSFNIANAGMTAEERADLLEGCLVETAYLAAPDAAEPYDSTYVIVLMGLEEEADAEGINPTLYGTVTYKDINELIIKAANGEEVTFDNTMSREVTFSSIEEGSKVRVTYMGSIYKENQETTDEGTGSGAPVAIKIVSEDAASSEEALADYLAGPVSSVGDGSITVDTSYDSFTFSADPSLLSGITEEQSVKVYYEGVLSTERTATATAITAG